MSKNKWFNDQSTIGKTWRIRFLKNIFLESVFTFLQNIVFFLLCLFHQLLTGPSTMTRTSENHGKALCVCMCVFGLLKEWLNEFICLFVCLFFLRDADQPLCHMVNWSFTLVKTNKSSFVPPHQFTAIGTVKIIRETVTFLCDLLLSVVVWQNTWKEIHWCQKNGIVWKVSAKTGGAVSVIVPKWAICEKLQLTTLRL